MALGFQQHFNIVKAPAAMPAAMDQNETGHEINLRC
jgi:hypothetical protein